ncbi:MAG: bifunctional heptose 7-phosphate kinase/heptose 1-phosphate adenyltransferase, partial [Lysobacterales bacterium]
MLDEYWFGDTARISPEAPVPVVRARSAEQRPGGAANVALNVAALGAGSTLAAVVGQDERGAVLTRALEQHGVRCELFRSPTLPTIHKLRVLARSQQLLRIDAEQSLQACADEFGALYARLVLEADAVILSDYGKGTLCRVPELVAAARAANIPVLVDPKGTDFERYRGASALTPNRGEFEAVVGRCADEADLKRKGEALRAELELDLLLVTRGEQGMTLFEQDTEPLTLPTQAREVFDVTG